MATVRVVTICLSQELDKFLTLPCDEFTTDEDSNVTVYFNGDIWGFFAHPDYAYMQEVDEKDLDFDDEDEDDEDDGEDEDDDEEDLDDGDGDNGGGGGPGDGPEPSPTPTGPAAGEPGLYEVVSLDGYPASGTGSVNGSLDALESASL